MDEPIKVCATILKASLGLKDDQVILYNQKFDIPPDDRLYLVLSVMGVKTFGANTGYENDPVSGELHEVQSVNRQEMFSVLLYSWSSDARTRNWEVPVALVSTLSQQLQEANSISISKVPTAMIDVSEVEGTKRLNRYSLTFNVLAAYTKRQPVDYFDQFNIPPEVITNS